MKIKVGCCGWSYLDTRYYFGPNWKKQFNSKLKAYAALFSAVETNSTFYRIPKLSTAKKWRDEVNKKFEFTVKASRIITHTRKFSENAVWAFEQMKEICRVLKTHILLLQTPDNFGPSDKNIAKMEQFFKKIKRGTLIITWEPRGALLNEPKLLKKICKKFDLVQCVDPLRDKPIYLGKANIAYFRLHGFGTPVMYSYNFSCAELIRLQNYITTLKVREVYVMFNNAFCYENALMFCTLLKNHK